MTHTHTHTRTRVYRKKVGDPRGVLGRAVYHRKDGTDKTVKAIFWPWNARFRPWLLGNSR
jgi:hypothetical protein